MNIARIASRAEVILGGWLFLSAFLWHHSLEQLINAACIGGASLVLGLWSLNAIDAHLRGEGAVARWTLGALGVWLFVSTFWLPTRAVATVVNHLLVGTLLFGFSVLPIGRGRPTGDRFPA